ncbi:YibE/F family protein [Lentilactobacillus raoultii]|uniref:YibE/F family protein n=1 Tax=Lentilactobacillus raoultii TaxID=1987503 RepID=A0ABW3PTH7_9LACO|nr:YibE/F family protein [Lentilactobacillus raoultii]
MTSITLMGIVLLIVMMIAGGLQGIKAFLSVGFNLVMMFLIIRLLSMDFPFLWVTLIGAAVILSMTIYLGVSDATVADASFISAGLVALILVILIIPVYQWAQVQGFGEENTSELESMSLLIGMKFIHLSMATAILSSLGAVGEAAVSVASGLKKTQTAYTQLSDRQFFSVGMAVGRQMLSTALNTLFFGFFGGFLALFIWFLRLDYSFGQLINNKIFVAEFLLILISILGVVLVIPLTVWVMMLKRRTKAQ